MPFLPMLILTSLVAVSLYIKSSLKSSAIFGPCIWQYQKARQSSPNVLALVTPLSFFLFLFDRVDVRLPERCSYIPRTDRRQKRAWDCSHVANPAWHLSVRRLVISVLRFCRRNHPIRPDVRGSSWLSVIFHVWLKLDNINLELPYRVTFIVSLKLLVRIRNAGICRLLTL